MTQDHQKTSSSTTTSPSTPRKTSWNHWTVITLSVVLLLVVPMIALAAVSEFARWLTEAIIRLLETLQRRERAFRSRSGRGTSWDTR